MTNLVVHRGADAFRKSPVIQGGRDGSVLDDKIVAPIIEIVGRHSRLDVRGDHQQNLRRQFAGAAHQFDFFVFFNGDHGYTRIPSNSGHFPASVP